MGLFEGDTVGLCEGDTVGLLVGDWEGPGRTQVHSTSTCFDGLVVGCNMKVVLSEIILANTYVTTEDNQLTVFVGDLLGLGVVGFLEGDADGASVGDFVGLGVLLTGAAVGSGAVVFFGSRLRF